VTASTCIKTPSVAHVSDVSTLEALTIEKCAKECEALADANNRGVLGTPQDWALEANAMRYCASHLRALVPAPQVEKREETWFIAACASSKCPGTFSGAVCPPMDCPLCGDNLVITSASPRATPPEEGR
jgi:hypothetical protein